MDCEGPGLHHLNNLHVASKNRTIILNIHDTFLDESFCTNWTLLTSITFFYNIFFDCSTRPPPIYSKGNNDRKQVLFWNTILKYKDFVTREYDIFSS